MDWVRIGSIGPGNIALMEMMHHHIKENHKPHRHHLSDGVWVTSKELPLEDSELPLEDSPEQPKKCECQKDWSLRLDWLKSREAKFCPWCGLLLYNKEEKS